MKRTVKFLVCSLLLFVVTMPSRACWWSDYDDWYGYDYDNDYNYNDYGNDSYDFENYDIIYDYENYEDSYDDIYTDDHGDDNFAWDVLLNDVVITGNDDAFWNDAIFQIDNSWLSDGEDPNDYNDPPSNDVEPTDPPGTNEDDTGNGNKKDIRNVGSSPCKESDWNKLTVEQMKFQAGVRYVPNLPDKFLPQFFRYECVANSISIVSNIVDGADPVEIREIIRKIASDAGYNLEKRGIPNSEICSVLKDYCAILDDNKFSRSVIENYLDNEHKPIMAVTDVVDSQGEFMGAHMFVIVAYDYYNYYCAYGKEKAAVIPKNDFEVKNSDGSMKYKVYMYNGKKRVNK